MLDNKNIIAMKPELEIDQKVTVQPITGDALECDVINIEKRAIGFNYYALGLRPGQRVGISFRIVKGVDGKWYEASTH